MQISQKRIQIASLLLFGLGMVVIGAWFLNQLINNVWLVPPENPLFNDFQRAVVNGTVDSTSLMQSSDRSMVAIFILTTAVIGTGLALPFVYLFNRRLELTRGMLPASVWLLLRQAFWFGLWLGFCTWLQMSRTFGLPVALLLAVVFVLFEVLIYARRNTFQSIFTTD